MKYRFLTYCYQYALAVLLTIMWAATVQAQQVLCVQDEALQQYTVDTSENGGEGSTNSTYTWLVEEANFAGTITPVTTSGNQISVDWAATPVGLYTISVTETNDSGCENIQLLSVEIQELPTLSLSAPEEVCSDEVIPLSASIGGSATAVTWSATGDGTFDNDVSLNPIYTPGATDIANGSASFMVLTNDPAGENGCEAASETISVIISEVDSPIFSISNEYCFGDSPESLPTVSSNGISGTWSPSTIATTINGMATYTFTPNEPLCIGSFELTVTINPCGCVFETTEVIELCQGEDFVFPDGTQADTSQMGEFRNEFLTPVADDCDLLDIFIVRVNGPLFPTAFTPNPPDGINDEFKILVEVCEISNYRLQIVNRWGEAVFETDNPEEGWNGRSFTGEILQNGVFVWIAEYTINDQEFQKEGTVQIVN